MKNIIWNNAKTISGTVCEARTGPVGPATNPLRTESTEIPSKKSREVPPTSVPPSVKDHHEEHQRRGGQKPGRVAMVNAGRNRLGLQRAGENQKKEQSGQETQTENRHRE
jgi:hypothetical protein